MWSRKKRKKEAAAAAAAAGGVVKEGAGSSNGSGPNPMKPMLSDVSRSRSQSGSPMKEPHQQRAGSVGPRAEPTQPPPPSLSLANGALPAKPQPMPSAVPLVAQQQQLLGVGGVAAAVVVPQTTPTNLKQQYPPNHNNLPIPPQVGGPGTTTIPPQVGGIGATTTLPPQVGGMGTSLPPQLPPHVPAAAAIAFNPQSQQVVGGVEPAIIQGGVAPHPVILHGGGEGEGGGIQDKQAYKTVAKSNVKPSLTVPLPTAPLSDNILESLHEVGGSNAVATAATTSVDTAGNGGHIVDGQSNPPGGISGPGSMDASLKVGGAGGGVTALSSTTSTATSANQLQQVIDAQRTQIALLARLVTDQKRLAATPQQNIPVSRGEISSGVAPGGRGERTSSIALRTQTFDYGNRSNKVLENAAVQQLEQEYYRGNQNTGKWS